MEKLTDRDRLGEVADVLDLVCGQLASASLSLSRNINEGLARLRDLEGECRAAWRHPRVGDVVVVSGEWWPDESFEVGLIGNSGTSMPVLSVTEGTLARFIQLQAGLYAHSPESGLMVLDYDIGPPGRVVGATLHYPPGVGGRSSRTGWYEMRCAGEIDLNDPASAHVPDVGEAQFWFDAGWVWDIEEVL